MARRANFLGLAGLALTAGIALAAGYGGGAFDVANACASSCRAQHNKCRIATKGSPACDRKLNQCLNKCLKQG